MDNIWIFVVIAIIIISVSNNRKIKKSLEETKAPESLSDDELDDFMIKKEADNRPKTTFGNYESVESMMMSRDEKLKQQNDSFEQNESVVKHEKSQIAEEFDMRKAVIYAEIMNPKFKE